jgi:hypothetical protein
MTDHTAPERVWIAPVHEAKHNDDFYLLSPTYRNGRGTEYIRDDLHRAEVDALVAAAYEDAADCAYNLRRKDWASENEDWDMGTHDAAVAISARTPDDARAALRAHTEAAVRRALEGVWAGIGKLHGDATAVDALHVLAEAIRDPAQFIGGTND